MESSVETAVPMIFSESSKARAQCNGVSVVFPKIAPSAILSPTETAISERSM